MARPITERQQVRDAEIVRCHCGAWRAKNAKQCKACEKISSRYREGPEPLR